MTTNTHQTEPVRLFFALWPDDATRTALMQLQTNMHGRLVTYENLHITLAFLGSQPVELISSLRDVLARLPRTELVLNLDKVGYFSRNKVAWVGMHTVPNALLELQRSLATDLQERGISFDSHPEFKPHITLARDASLPADLVFTPIQWKANEVTLMQSVTKASGPAYKVLASRSLDQEIWIPGEL